MCAKGIPAGKKEENSDSDSDSEGGGWREGDGLLSGLFHIPDHAIKGFIG
jgi:hypothetical protein